MKTIHVTALALTLGLCGFTHANQAVNAAPASPAASAASDQGAETEVDLDEPQSNGSATTSPVTPDVGSLCFFAGKPSASVKYTVIRRIKVAKGTYGGVRDVLPKFAAHARKQGADAVIDYTGSQRFGFWPWRMVRPVLRGTAVKWDQPPEQDCAALGGKTLTNILETDQAPQ